MRIAIAILLTVNLCTVSAQVNNIYASGGISQTVGAPTFRPGAKGNIVAIDTVTGAWYVSRDRNSVNWLNMGKRIEKITGCGAPAYTPNKYNSTLVINSCASPDFPKIYEHVSGTTWNCLNCAGGAVETDGTLSGDGSSGDPLTIAQQGAVEGQGIFWTGTAWEPSWGDSYTFVTSGATITTAVNTVLIGTISADITIGLPTCNAANDGKIFEFKKNGSDSFGATIDPAGAQTFYDGAANKKIYSPLNINCACRYSGGSGVWFFTY